MNLILLTIGNKGMWFVVGIANKKATIVKGGEAGCGVSNSEEGSFCE